MVGRTLTDPHFYAGVAVALLALYLMNHGAALVSRVGAAGSRG